MLALLPFNIILPLVYFFLRKDRLICGGCRKLLPEGAAVAMLPALPAGAAPPGGALVVAPSTALLSSRSPEALRLRDGAKASRAFGVALAVLAALAGVGMLPVAYLAAVAFGTAWAAAMFVPSGLLGAGAAVLLRRAGRLGRQAVQIETAELRERVWDLARQHEGRLNVGLVAGHLGRDRREAELLLDSLVDGEQVDLEMDDDGNLFYTFHIAGGVSPAFRAQS